MGECTKAGIRGTVTDQAGGDPIPGVTVTIEGVSGVGTITDTKGEYYIGPETAMY